MKLSCKQSATSGLWRHLKKHPSLNRELERRLEEREKKEKKDKERKKMNLAKQTQLSFYNSANSEKDLQEKFEGALLKFIGNSGVNFYQAAGLKEVVSIANKKLRVPSRHTLSRKTDSLANSLRHKILGILTSVNEAEELLSVCFTTDFWSSNTGFSLMSLTMRFIDHKWNVHMYTPYVKPFDGAHTGIRKACSLDELIRELKLESSNIKKYSVNDNASNQRKAICESDFLKEYSCDVHTMNLLIVDTFDEYDEMNPILDKCQSIAKVPKYSQGALEELKSECKTVGIPFYMPKKYPVIRWNSHNYCIFSIHILKKQPPLRP